MSDRARCLDCGAEHDVEALEPFEDALDLEPGDEVPAGRCPAKLVDPSEPNDADAVCGAQCLLVDGHYWHMVEEQERQQGLRAFLKRIEWTASPASSETDPELFCPGCDATCDALDRHDLTFGGECPHCGQECDDEENPAAAYGPEGSCPRRHADNCPLAAAIR